MSFPRYPEYKASGVAWLGEVPGHWGVQPLKRLISRVDQGDSPQCLSEPAAEGEWGVLKVGCVNGGDFAADEQKALPIDHPFDPRAEVREGDLVMSRGNTLELVGSVAYVGAVRAGLLLSDLLYRFRPIGPNHGKFLAYWLGSRSGRYQIECDAVGTSASMKKVSKEVLAALAVVCPPAAEQHAIAAFLDRETARIDALVAEQERLIELLREKRQAVISHAVTKGLDPTVPMKDSGVEWLGEVPAHWEIKPLKHLVVQSVAGPYGASLTKAMYSDSGYRVYGQQQVITNDFAAGDYFITEEKYEEMKQYTVSPGDVLVTVMGTIGRVAVVPPDAHPGIINPRLVLYRCGTRIRPTFLRTTLMSARYQELLSYEAKGTTMDGLNMGILGGIAVVTPPIDEQDRILAKLSVLTQAFDSLIAEAERAIALLQERRAALISAAVTGQIDVLGVVQGPTE